MTINEITSIELLQHELKVAESNLKWTILTYNEDMIEDNELQCIKEKCELRIEEYEQAIKQLLK